MTDEGGFSKPIHTVVSKQVCNCSGKVTNSAKHVARELSEVCNFALSILKSATSFPTTISSNNIATQKQSSNHHRRSPNPHLDASNGHLDASHHHLDASNLHLHHSNGHLRSSHHHFDASNRQNTLPLLTVVYHQ